MKVRILSLFSLLALLLVSTSILADGRPTGIRIGRLVSGGGNTVEVDITVTGTNQSYTFNSSYVQWIGPTIWGATINVSQITSNGDPLPCAVDWGDSEYLHDVPLFGGGPWVGTFSHTYDAGGTYTVTVGDAYGPDAIINKGVVPYTGNPITGSTRYVWYRGTLSTWTSSSPSLLLAITDQGTVSTGTGIPALNIYGLLAMSLVLVGAGILVFRRPQRTAV